ncbi:hypothetical protein ACLB1E_05085 [Escherichia coli]
MLSQRQEIKDALVSAPDCQPQRLRGLRVCSEYTNAGIGDRTPDVVRQTSRDRQLTLWQACRAGRRQEKALAGRAASALQRFMELIHALAQETAHMPLHAD